MKTIILMGVLILSGCSNAVERTDGVAIDPPVDPVNQPAKLNWGENWNEGVWYPKDVIK